MNKLTITLNFRRSEWDFALLRRIRICCRCGNAIPIRSDTATSTLK